MEKRRRRLPKILLSILGILVLLAGAYLAYVVIAFDRIEDKQDLKITAPTSGATGSLPVDKTFRILTYNIGFGAYSPDYTFFMDGGTESRAFDKKSVINNTNGAIKQIESYKADFVMLEEVDKPSTRSYHVDQLEMISDSLKDYYSNFALNYDSPYLLYPVTEPIGKSVSGIAFYSKYPVSSAMRRSLPVASGFNKFFDLDRCYSVSRLPTKDGKEFCIYSAHLSAYGHDANVRNGQISMLMNDMAAERKAGNYVICGGDFNHDLKNLEVDETKVESWCYPFQRSDLPAGFTIAMDGLTEDEKAALPESTRNTDIPYDPAKSFMVTLDGFIVSDNVKCTSLEVKDTQFEYSDHNPVLMEFKLIGE